MPCTVANFFLNNGGQITKAGETHNYPVMTASPPSSVPKEIVLSKDRLSYFQKSHLGHSAAEAVLAFPACPHDFLCRPTARLSRREDLQMGYPPGKGRTPEHRSRISQLYSLATTWNRHSPPCQPNVQKMATTAFFVRCSTHMAGVRDSSKTPAGSQVPHSLVSVF